MSDPRCIPLDEIVTDAGTQVRAELNESTVDEYAAQMLEGVKFPPVTVFHDGSRFILTDGFHRVLAARRAEFLDILADVKLGGKPEALRFALAANVKHGLPRTNADKRRSVELALAMWPDLSSREIAKACAVHHDLVERIRTKPTENQLAESASSNPGQLATVASSEPAKRKGADGKSRKAPAKSPAPDAGGLGGNAAGEVNGFASPAATAPITQDQELIAALGADPETFIDGILAGIARDVDTVSRMDAQHRCRVAAALRDMAEQLEV